MTELFNATMAERGIAVESTLVPFARGQQVISEILHAGTNCPDLIRIDSSWLARLNSEDQGQLLMQVPPELARLDWLPEAPSLVGSATGLLAATAIPQAIDGLVIVRDVAAPKPPTSSIDDLVDTARAAQRDDRKFPLGLRADGYWLVPWLRAHGSDLVTGRGNPASEALAAFAALFGTIAAPPPPAGSEAPEELRRWTSHEVAYWVTGPWQIGALHDRDHIEISALAGAPRGGQLLVVPTCAKHPAEGWRLAGELVSVPLATKLAVAFATVPTRRAALAAAPPLVHTLYEALQGARPLNSSSVTPLLFDDLNPAISAVIEGDASADEAMLGVQRGWSRLVSKQP